MPSGPEVLIRQPHETMAVPRNLWTITSGVASEGVLGGCGMRGSCHQSINSYRNVYLGLINP